MLLSSLIAIANFKTILDFIKDFFKFTRLHEVGFFIISQTLFFGGIFLRK
jgi:hypothetical protein